MFRWVCHRRSKPQEALSLEFFQESFHQKGMPLLWYPFPEPLCFGSLEVDCSVVCIHFATGNCSSLSSSWILRILWSCVSPESLKCFDAVVQFWTSVKNAAYSWWFCFVFFILFCATFAFIRDLSQVCNDSCWLTSNLEAYNYLYLSRIAWNMDQCFYL